MGVFSYCTFFQVGGLEGSLTSLLLLLAEAFDAVVDVCDASNPPEVDDTDEQTRNVAFTLGLRIDHEVQNQTGKEHSHDLVLDDEVPSLDGVGVGLFMGPPYGIVGFEEHVRDDTCKQSVKRQLSSNRDEPIHDAPPFLVWIGDISNEAYVYYITNLIKSK